MSSLLAVPYISVYADTLLSMFFSSMTTKMKMAFDDSKLLLS